MTYLIFNVLSILFGLISLGMLSPFLDILFDTEGPAAKGVLFKETLRSLPLWQRWQVERMEAGKGWRAMPVRIRIGIGLSLKGPRPRRERSRAGGVDDS